MNKPVELLVGAVGGAIASQVLEFLIAEAKVVLAFPTVSKELATTMTDLRPIIRKIESYQSPQSPQSPQSQQSTQSPQSSQSLQSQQSSQSPQSPDELKTLTDTINEARVLVSKCKDVKWWAAAHKSHYTRKVWKIQKRVVSFCQVQLQVIQLRNQLESKEDTKKLDSMMEDIDSNIKIVTEKFDRLMEEMNKNQKIIIEKLDHLSDPHVPVPSDLCSVPKLAKDPVGFDWPLDDLKEQLRDDSVDCLVVSGASGRGKTTLVTQLCHDEDIKGMFTHIFFNVVSSSYNFRKLVQNLLQHNGHSPPPFEDDNQAIYRLQKLLKKLRKDGPILMVLDDVWHGAESLIRKFKQIDLQGYKILVTSRTTLPNFCCSNYELKPLDHEDAKDLLIQWAPRPPNASGAEYEDLLKKILKRCKGLPIIIEVVGKSLEGQSLNTWKDKVESWSKEETVLDFDNVQESLQPTFDALESNLKECFMDMGVFPEDQKISGSVLIDIWVELYTKGGSTLYMEYLENLSSQNMLKLIPLGKREPEDGFYNEFLVTQHDAFRELAIHQCELEATLERTKLNLEKGNFPDWCQSEAEAIIERKRLNLQMIEDNLRDCSLQELETIMERKRLHLEIREDKFPSWCLNLKHTNARLLYVSTDDLFLSNWIEMEFPNVEALVLNISSPKYTLPSFIKTMVRLKVVIITYHGFYPPRLSNIPCLRSLPNLKRLRLERVSITFLDILRLQHSSLKKISLVMCRFGELSHDTKGIDVPKALPSLEELDIDYCYDLVELPSWISEVVSLKTLSMTNCNKLSKLPETLGNLKNLETLRLNSCSSLVELPETVERLGNLRFLDVCGCFQLKKFPLETGNLKNLKKILMRDCYRSELPDSVKKLKDLVVTCDEGTVFVWQRFRQKMTSLTIIEEEREHNLNFLQQF